MNIASFRLFARPAIATLSMCVMLFGAAAAQAQYRPRPLNDPATGEKFHIEGGAGYWNPTSDITVASAGSGALTGLAGTEINAKRDLGFTDKKLPNLSLVLRPAPAHKFRLDFVPIKFEGATTVNLDIV